VRTEFPQRRRHFRPGQRAPESLRYLGVSAIAFVVDTAVLLTLATAVGTGSLTAATAGFCCGLVTSWSLSERWVFRGPRASSAWSRFVLFALTGLIGLVQLNLLIWLLADDLGLLWSKVLATGVVYLSCFALRRAIYARGAAQNRASNPTTAVPGDQGSNL
jgi:putative flippase GtrA